MTIIFSAETGTSNNCNMLQRFMYFNSMWFPHNFVVKNLISVKMYGQAVLVLEEL